MLDQIFHILEQAASSEHAALIIALAAAVVFAWIWLRREAVLMEHIRQRDSEVSELAREAYEVLQDVAAALAGMERTLEGLEALVRVVLDHRLHGSEEKDEA
jgi:hypothetical protein